jgi:cyclopropane fatty-acyl-phospholipid synthase-like methyltransferase
VVGGGPDSRPISHSSTFWERLVDQNQAYLPGFEPLDQRLHYDLDPVGFRLGLEGGGPLVIMTGDQLHPPMVDDESIWADGRRWQDGAIRHTLEAANLCDFVAGNRVIDLGCGLCGPARRLVDRYNVSVTSISTSRLHVRSAGEINTRGGYDETIDVLLHDCQTPLPRGPFDVAWSMNMLFHVPNHAAMLSNCADALRSGGRLMIDDWMFTPRATSEDRAVMQQHFLSPHLAVREQLIEQLSSHGFEIRRFVDLGHVGRTHLANYFVRVFRRDFAPTLLEIFGEAGAVMSAQFEEAVGASIRLYREEKLVYARLVAVRTS